MPSTTHWRAENADTTDIKITDMIDCGGILLAHFKHKMADMTDITSTTLGLYSGGPIWADNSAILLALLKDCYLHLGSFCFSCMACF